MKKLFLFLILLTATLPGFSSVQIGDLYYNLNGGTMTAEVTYEEYSSPYNYLRLSSIIIPETVTYNNRSYSVTKIGNSAFHKSSGLTSVEIPNSVKSIEENAFRECIRLSSILFGNSVTSIGNNAFKDCVSLTGIEIPDPVTSIGKSAFENCRELTSVGIPNSVNSIGESAFDHCNSLTNVYISDLEAWCRISFKNGYSNPLFYAHRLFLNNEEVKDLIIPDSVTAIGNHAFKGCWGLTSLKIPDSVTSIGNDAFYECSGLTSLTIPSSVAYMGYYVFAYCTSLTTLKIEDGEDALRFDYTYTEVGPFLKCPLESLYLGRDLRYVNYGYSQEYGMPAFSFIKTLKEITIGDSVTKINESAFRGCSGLKNVVFGNSVTTIGDYAFYECSDLTGELILPESVTSIGDYAFYECNGLTGELIIPDAVTSIGESAFLNFGEIIKLYIGEEVRNIGDKAFAGNTHLESISVAASIPPVANKISFANPTYWDATLYVPGRAMEYYKSQSPWSHFIHLESLDDSGAEMVEVDRMEAPYDIFNMKGQLVKRQASRSDIDALSQGIYIIGGKKVIIK